MSLLGIRVLGDPILRQATRPVEEFGEELQRLVDDMFETMKAADGIGLAAPQVGRTERLAVIDIKGERLVVINAEIVERSSETDSQEEGCLSIPEVYGNVTRPVAVTVRALDRHGASIEVQATELLARCLQHEIDHLDGKLFIDYLSVLKRGSAMAKWTKEKAKYPNGVRILTPQEVAQHHHRDEEL